MVIEDESLRVPWKRSLKWTLSMHCGGQKVRALDDKHSKTSSARLQQPNSNLKQHKLKQKNKFNQKLSEVFPGEQVSKSSHPNVTLLSSHTMSEPTSSRALIFFSLFKLLADFLVTPSRGTIGPNGPMNLLLSWSTFSTSAY